MAAATMLAAITTASTLPVFAAEQIRGIDFIAAPGETNIMIRSDARISYHTVSASNQKIIIDLDDVNAEDSINTFFKGSRNVSHVVLQPLSHNKLRMIIKGDNLGKPVLGFDRNGVKSIPKAMSKQAQEEEGWINDVENQLDEMANTEMDHTETDNLEISSATTAKNTAPEPRESINSFDFDNDENISDTQASETLPITRTSATENQPLSLPAIPLKDMAPYGIAVALLIGLGVFIKRKLDQTHLSNASFNTLMSERDQGKAVSFQQLANAYRGDNNTAPARPQRRSNSKSPIGLGSFTPNNDDNLTEGNSAVGEPPMTADTLRALQNRMANASRNNIIPDRSQQSLQAPPPARRQAINQYAKTRQPALKKQQAPAARPIARPQTQQHSPDEVLRAELARSRDVQSQMGVRPKSPAQPARPVPSAGSQRPALKNPQPVAPRQNPNGSPLPDNPAVLNFLKDVADRIEKEGKPNLAHNIQKSIRKNPGL